MLSRSDGFILCGKTGVELFSTPELHYSFSKNKLRLIRDRLNIYISIDHPSDILGIGDCSLNTLS